LGFQVTDSVAAVLRQLAESGVSARWSDENGKAVFKAAARPPAEVIALIEARKAEISAFLHPESVKRRLDAEAEAIGAKRPVDTTDERWEEALRGLMRFRADGHGAAAERAGWSRDELYASPPLWARIDLCGAALLIGDREVIEVSAEAIRIRTASGAVLSLYRRPGVDYGLAYATRRRELARHFAGDEPHFRAFDHAVGLCRQRENCGLEEAKTRVRAAIARRTPQ
jgi:hypothetical protein